MRLWNGPFDTLCIGLIFTSNNYFPPFSIGAWNVYNTQKKNYFEINSGLSGFEYKDGHAARFWNEYLPYLCQQFNGTNFSKGKIIF